MSDLRHAGWEAKIARLKGLTVEERTLLNLWFEEPDTPLALLYLPKNECEPYSTSTLYRREKSILTKLRVSDRDEARSHYNEVINHPASHPPATQPWDNLSVREQEIFLRLTDEEFVDLPLNEQAKRFYIAPTTLKKHLQHIYRKLEVQTRTRAVLLAVKARDCLSDSP